MNYQRIYDSIIQFRRQNAPSGYGEFHHIVPRSFGGSNDKSNLVKLTAREHFICHVLLVKIYRNDKFLHAKMLKAVMMMLTSSGNQHRYKPSLQYKIIREQFALAMSENQSGKR